MVKGSKLLLKGSGIGINNTLAEILVCPLSKQPLRLCKKINALISDSIGVSYPIVNGIPRLVPMDGKLIDSDERSNSEEPADSPNSKTERIISGLRVPPNPTRPELSSVELQVFVPIIRIKLANNSSFVDANCQ
ncbi:uncharacterized protein LOC111390835 isoform X1 [Olea europaea var. sylvestris]|uniref:uncharacterized protein LOC111390835 isoform X1 n=1 Tax=Olea europaea var. sylvestris TaxID=158386 RepID=UPI000C1D5149|nr:uncharacterized protein LOC111390835 isoform X1 [Olea europaea var. sylvestris]